MRFDHSGYVVADSDATINAIKPFYPEVIRYKELLAPQKALITLLSTQDKLHRIELVEPLPDNILLNQMLIKTDKQSVPYHICFVTDDFDKQYKSMKQAGWTTLTRPFTAFSSEHRASHLYHPAVGIIEIMTKPL
ncbi:VOC family protein [Dickeya sp. CFBP 2040]|uniref:VOC family protein n=1 Tax=Dickeya poaceiphila TaxID=568768 RepID=A0A5B8IA90_9GAMM|nr:MULTISPECIES: VOC family protein [Dickeya]NKI73714.1 VOC family protein [Dickeya sp. CFBP 2040]QDX31502.1 VOC family protein [Dickeya poaceiphila]